MPSLRNVRATNYYDIFREQSKYLIIFMATPDPPIDFQVMQGQDVQTPTDLMQQQEEAAVNTIMPYELVNATLQQDFATRYSMSNTRFLRTILTRQRKVQRIFTDIYTPLYNYNYDTTFPEIKVILPPPLFLIMQNNSNLIDNMSAMADKIADFEITGEDEKNDAIKAEFKKLYLRKNLSTYLKYDVIDRLIDQAKVLVKNNEAPPVEETPEGDEEVNDMMDDSL